MMKYFFFEYQRSQRSQYISAASIVNDEIIFNVVLEIITILNTHSWILEMYFSRDVENQRSQRSQW